MLAKERNGDDKSVLIPERNNGSSRRCCLIVWAIIFICGLIFITLGVALLISLPQHSVVQNEKQSSTKQVITYRLLHPPITALHGAIGAGGALMLLSTIFLFAFCCRSQQNEYIKESLSSDQSYQSTIQNSPSRLHSFLKTNASNERLSRERTDSAVLSQSIQSINDVNWMKKYPRRISTGGFKLVSHKRPSVGKVCMEGNSLFNQRLQSFGRNFHAVIPEDNTERAASSESCDNSALEEDDKNLDENNRT